MKGSTRTGQPPSGVTSGRGGRPDSMTEAQRADGPVTLRRSRRPGQRCAAIVSAAAVGALTAACGAAAGPGSPSSAGSPPAGQSASAAGPASSAPASGPPAKPTSCNVITQAEAAAALGQSVKPPIKGKATVEGGVACVFYGPNVPAGASPDIPYGDTVRVVLVTGPTAKKYFNDYRSKVNAKPVSGLGDAAFYDGFASISVLKGDAYVRIAVGIFNNLGPEKMLAADALPRM